MNTTVLQHSLERMDRLSEIRNSFKMERNNLPMNTWLKISDDWKTAYYDNVETTEELDKRFEDVCEHENTMDAGDAERQAMFCVDCEKLL